MKYALTAVLGTVLWSACAAQNGQGSQQVPSQVDDGKELTALLIENARHQGQEVRQLQFRVDGGKTLSFSMLYNDMYDSTLPLPAENEDYVIPVSEYVADLKAGNVEQSRLQPRFSVYVKKYPAVELEYVRLEQVDTTDGRLQLLLQDEVPILNNQGSWLGRPIPVAVSREALPWLYSGGDSILLFKFTIKAQGSPAVVMYQPLFFGKDTKDRYLQIIRRDAS